tara:strand:+ start:1664 stop:3028 length:1365 start_codon:yes stop_codon:yes gene_type:complete
MDSGIATLSPSKSNGVTNIFQLAQADKPCGAGCPCCLSPKDGETKYSKDQIDILKSRPIRTQPRSGARNQSVKLTDPMTLQEQRQCSSDPACPSSQHYQHSRRTTTAMRINSDRVVCEDCEIDDEQSEKHSDNGAPPATKQGYGIPRCGHSEQPSYASDAATIDVFKQIEALCDRKQVADPNSVISDIMKFNQQRLEKARQGDVLFSRLTKRNTELTQAREFLRKPGVEFIGFIGWGKGCIGKLTHGNGSSAVEGFLYRQNGITCYQRLGSSLGIFNQLKPQDQRSNDSIDGPFASKFAQIIEIKGPDGGDIHQVYSYNSQNPRTENPKNLNDMYPNGYGILQSKKAAKYLLDFDRWVHTQLKITDSKFKKWNSDQMKMICDENQNKDSLVYKVYMNVHNYLHEENDQLKALSKDVSTTQFEPPTPERDMAQYMQELTPLLVKRKEYASLRLST